MKRLLTKNFKQLFFFTVVVIVVIASCIEIRGVDQPLTVKAGDTLTVQVKAWMDPYWNHPQSRLIIGFMAPKSWKAKENIRMYYTSTFDNGTMSPVSANATPASSSQKWSEAIMERVGIGGNYINDLEWVVFQSDKAYDMSDLPEINATVTIKVKVGPENLRVKLGYFNASSMMELSEPKYYGKWFTNCLEVTDGVGELIDFCSPQISAVQPLPATDNDILTLKYDEDAIQTGLSGADKVFLCAKATTTTGEVIEVCNQAATAALTALGGKKWRIDIWPRQYFNLRPDQTLEKMEYYYTDVTGTIKVLKQGDTGDPFTFKFGCQ